MNLTMKSPLLYPLVLHTKQYIAFYLLLWTTYCLFYASATTSDNNGMLEVDAEEEEPHPDPNEENYPGMIYIGRMDDDGRRVGFDADNGT